MYKNLKLIVVLAVCPFLACCQNESLQPAVMVPTSSPEAIHPADATDVNFGGVSFRYNPKIFGEVVSSEIEEYRLKESHYHPNMVAPKHIVFTFGLANQYDAANLKIYPVRDFPRMFEKNENMENKINKAFKDLRKVLTNKDLRFDGQIPFIPFRNGGQELHAKVKLSKFENGKGIFFVTHWGIEAALLSNDLLYYVFIGLTDDGKYYVIAETPINVDFLPRQSPDEFERYRISDLYDRSMSENDVGKRHKLYISSIESRLEALSPDKYNPGLHHLDEIISSLKITK